MPLSKRVTDMKESATLAMSRKCRALIAQGEDIINLSIGQPDFDTPENIKQAAKEALDQGYTKYPPVPGDIDLRTAISNKFLKENDLDYSPAEICVSTGAKQSIMNTLHALVDPCDEVILFSPYWVSYIEQVRFVGGIPICITSNVEDGYKINSKELEEKISEKTKLVIFSSPSNPSGTAYSENELKEISKIILQHKNLYVLSDEIYEYLNYDEKNISIGSLPGMKERTITVNGVAKGFAMTGWRIGYIGAPSWITDACVKIQGQFTSGANSIAQRATIEALNKGKESVSYMIEEYEQRRNIGFKKLSEIEGVKLQKPGGAFYFFPDVSSFFGKRHEKREIANAAELCEYLLDEGKVACVDGAAFGNPNCLRLSFALSTVKLLEAIERMDKALQKLH